MPYNTELEDDLHPSLNFGVGVEEKERSFFPFLFHYSGLLCILTAVLLVLSYPLFDFFGLAWVALIPMMWDFEEKSPRQAFQLGYFTGCLFFLGMFYWFIAMHETAGIPLILAVMAVVALVAYLALYFGLFGYGCAVLYKLSSWKRYFCIPSLWVVLEFVRDRFFTGFGWASLGHSQYRFLPVIQIADITGVFGVSFLIVFVNLVLMDLLKEFFVENRTLKDRKIFVPLLVLILVSGLVLSYGLRHCRHAVDYQSRGELKVALVQGNIPQRMKWLPLQWPEIMQSYVSLSQEAVAQKPDLVIWPETAFPGYLWESMEMFRKLQEDVKRMHVPLLFGAVLLEREDRYFNSAFLMTPDGEVHKKHDKLHLVPFGEYIPFRKQFPFLGALIPILDFQPGQVETLFPVLRRSRTAADSPDSPPAGTPDAYELMDSFLSVLICFEDTVAPVSRKLVRRGTHLLVNITNDAWFLAKKAPWLHLQAAVFQAVSCRRYLIRAANTGVTCFIDPTGDLYGFVQDAEHQKVFVDGFSTGKVQLLGYESFYSVFGDVFVLVCFILIGYGIIILKVRAS